MVRIQAENIEKELDKLWTSGGDKRVRASLFNLVAYSQDPARTAYLKEIIQEAASKFPCRIILIQQDSRLSADSLEVDVSDEITPAGNSSIGCDVIEIKSSPQQLQRVPFIILPHLIPDLPIYLLWGHNPIVEKNILPLLLPHASRLIFDSDCVDDLPHYSKELLSLMNTSPNLEVIDINWVRTEDWRNVMRQIFTTEKALHFLRDNLGIEIRYCNKRSAAIKHPELQALYLVGWLAAQMQWKKSAHSRVDNEWKLDYQNGTHTFSLLATPKENYNFAPGTIAEVEINGAENTIFSICPVPNTSKVVVHISSETLCEMPFTLPMPCFKKGFSFIGDLLFERTSQHYKNLLKNL